MKNLKGYPNPPRVLADWPAGDDTLLSERELAALLDVKSNCIKFWRWRQRRRGPNFIRLGGPRSAVRYRVGDVRHWLREQTIETRSGTCESET